jgi:hypothetical protein
MSAKALRIGAAAAVAAGLVAGGTLFFLGGRAKEQTVEGFARAPVGCTTTLQFDTADTFTFYVETKGEAGDLGGDCAGNGAVYDRGDDDPPQVALTLVDANGGEVPLRDSSRYSYDTGRFVGSAIKDADVTAGTYRLTVESDSTDFAIAIGRDPEVDSSSLQALGAAIALLGLVIGVALVLFSLRTRPEPPTPLPADGMWRPQPPMTAPVGVPSVPGFVPPPPSTGVPPVPAQWAPPPPPPPTVAPPPPDWGSPPS